MKRTSISMMILRSICFAALTQPVWGQAAQNPRPALPRHLGGLTTMPKPTAVEDNFDLAQAALATFGGKFTFKIAITIKSTNLGSDTIECNATASVGDFSTTTGVNSGSYIEEESVLATRSGSTATCTVNIPYSWGLANGSTDLVGLSYGVEAFNTNTNSLPIRIHDRSLPNMHVPANGTTTTITVNATI